LRFKTFQALAVPFEQIKGSRYWNHWVEVSARRDEIERAAHEIDQTLAKEAGTPENAQLYSDLLAIYETAKAEVTITEDDGSERPYVATRFKQAIDRGQREGTLVPVVGRIVRGPTEGFGRLAEAGRRDLMVETLVLDESKPYHRFFTAKSKELAQANLDFMSRNTAVSDRRLSSASRNQGRSGAWAATVREFAVGRFEIGQVDPVALAACDALQFRDESPPTP
jgi:hypothetical protein